MAVSLEQAYGATAAANKKKSETNFFVSAAAGVASGLIKIPAGVVSLGAELLDLGLGTELAEEVENFFDDLNPFDEVAESRGIGKITQALASIGPVAIKGATIGVKAASALRASNLAKRALAAKKAGTAVSLSKFGQVIQKGQDVLTTPLAGGIIGSGVGESLVSDEDIGTLGDMLKGTSLEPFAITMMDTESKEGRSEAFRRLTNRIKFGTEGALFNLGITGAGKGVSKLREPSTYGLERWKEGGIMASVEKALYGLKPSYAGTRAAYEAQRLGIDLTQAAKAEAANEVATLHKSIKDVVPKLDKSLNLDEVGILKELQDILQPLPGKKLDSIKLQDLPGMIESKSGIKNRARGSFEYEYSGTGDKQTRKLITKEKIIGDPLIGQKGFFSLDDYSIIKGGKADKFLSKIEKGGGQQAKKEFENIIKNMRSTVDNLTGKISQKDLAVELSEKLHSELGNYLTADYAQFNQSTIPFFRINRSVAEIKEPALKSYIEQEKNSYRISQAETLKKLPGQQGIRPEDIVIPDAEITKFTREGTSKIDRYLKAKNLDELDPEKAVEKILGEPITKIESDAIAVQTSVLKRKKLDEWEEIVLGRIKDPTYNFINSVSKMASLNYTLDYVNTIAKQGSTKGGSVVVDGGITKFLNSVGEEINIKELTEDNIKKGRVKQKTFSEVDGKQYTAEETLAIATKETEDLLKTEFDRSKYIFGEGDAMGSTASAADDLVKAGKAADLVEADIMLRDPKQFKQVKSTGIDGLSALDGKWMQAPQYDTVFDTTTNWLNNLGTAGTIYKYGVLGPKTISQISKTVLNALTHVRNFISAGAFVAANSSVSVLAGGEFKSLLPTSLGGNVLKTGKLNEGILETVRRMSAYRLNPKQDRAVADLVMRSARVGVGGGTQAEVGEIIKMTSDFGGNIMGNLTEAQGKAYNRLIKGKKFAKKFYEKTQQLYVEEDTFHKNINWFLERNRFENIFKELNINESNFKDALKGKGVTKDVRNFLNNSVERFYDKATRTFDGDFQLFMDEVGGKLTRNNIPNYAYVGRFGRALRMSPFGNFIAFPLEIMRSGSNIVDTSIKEMSSNIPAIQKLGKQRLASFALTVGGIPQVAKQTGMALNDVDNKEMEALRRVVPEWSKNSTLVPVGRDKNGYLKYVDFSYSNAYDFLIRPIQAVTNAVNEGKEDGISLKASMGEGLQDGMRELLEPFASESILSEAVIDSVIRGGVGKDGRRVWQEEDEPFEKMLKAVGHIGKQVIPMGSTFKQMQRIGQATLDKTGKYGEEYKLKDELPGMFGFRAVSSNPERSLKFKISSFGSSLKKSENLFTSPLLKGGRVSPEEILERYQYSESRRFQFLKQMAKDVEAMRDLGVEENVIRKKLEARKGLGKNVVSNVLFGEYTPKKPSDFFVTRMNEINNDLNEKEGVSIANPFYEALPSINQIINKNFRINLLDDEISFSQLGVERKAEGGRVGMQEGGEPANEEEGKVMAASVWNKEPEQIKEMFEYDFSKYYFSGIWAKKLKEGMVPEPQENKEPSNVNPVVNSKIAPSTVAQLGAPGTNTNLTQPLKVEDVFKTGIV